MRFFDSAEALSEKPLVFLIITVKMTQTGVWISKAIKVLRN